MLLQQILKSLSRGWKFIVLVMLIAVAISLFLSITLIPQYRSQATFIIAPNKDLPSSRDIVSAFSALDTLKIFSTYADILTSKRVYSEAIKGTGLDEIDLVDYSKYTNMSEESIILILTVEGPDPNIAVTFANEIGKYGIQLINAYYSVFVIDFLDPAILPEQPFKPAPLNDALIAAGIGLIGGMLMVLIQEQLKAPISFFLQKFATDVESGAYSKRYTLKSLYDLKKNKENLPISLILVKLKGLEDVINVLPVFSRKRIFSMAVTILKKHLKGHDIIGRWDDLTLVVILPKTPKKVVGMMANRLLQALAEPVIYGIEDEDRIDLAPIHGASSCEKDQEIEQLGIEAEKSLQEVED